MKTRSVGKAAGLFVIGAALAGAMGVSSANAQAPAPEAPAAPAAVAPAAPAAAPPAGSAAAVPAAGCFVEPARLSDAEINGFVSYPTGLLTQYASGGLPLSNRVRSLVGSSQDTFEPIMALLAGATPSQVAAIGAGLARAARACSTTNPEYAALIQDRVAGSDIAGLETAFLAGSSETQTAALGGAAGGGSPTGGASGIGGGGASGGGSNGGAGTTIATASGNSAFDAGGRGSFFSNGDTSTSTSPTN